MITDTQMQAIEHAADQARQHVRDHLAAYGCIFDDTYAYLFDPDITLQAAVGLVTGGPVEPCPNLIRRDERLAGVLEWMGTTPFIYYEAYDLVVRQRFSIAHELGHFRLHAQQREHCQCTHAAVDPQDNDDEPLATTSRQEREADAFAAAFLMPQALLRADVAQFGHCVSFLAARYQVSEPAMRRRLRRLGL
jgi:IrrE N-terminal-like domain